jgi:long-subunit acyl-CoA synthetase (AMP-forming)
VEHVHYLELCSTNNKHCLNTNRCFGGEILEGYGMAETSCVISTMDIGDRSIGHVGSPNPSCSKLLVFKDRI